MSGVSEGRQVCQKVVRCVRRSSGVLEGRQVCQKVVRCVRRSSGVSEGRQVCQKVIRCLSRSSSLSVSCQVGQKVSHVSSMGPVWIWKNSSSSSSSSSSRKVKNIGTCHVRRQDGRCVRRSSGVSEGRQVCQKVVRCVRRLSLIHI